MEKSDFIKRLPSIRSYNALRRFVLEANMPNVAASELNIPKEQFKDILYTVEEAVFDVEYLKSHYEEIAAANQEAITLRHEELLRLAEERKKAVANDRSDRWTAMMKNRDLVSDYESFKSSMCGDIGQRRVKLLLNRLIKAGDLLADLYRTVLEIENVNINAKKYRNTRDFNYKDDLYAEKENLLQYLIGLCGKYNKSGEESSAVCGKQKSSNYSANFILYFDLPGMAQVSFHTNLSPDKLQDVPLYVGEWDGKVNSTLGKVEAAINERYKAELDKLRAADERKRARAGATLNTHNQY